MPITRKNCTCGTISKKKRNSHQIIHYQATQSWTIAPVILPQTCEITPRNPRKICDRFNSKKETEWTSFGLARETGYGPETMTSHALSRPDNLIFSPWSGVRVCVTWRCVCSQHCERRCQQYSRIVLSQTGKKEVEEERKSMCVPTHAHTRVIWETEKECVRVCVCACGLQARERERRTRMLAEGEEANRLHYANTVQLQLTMAKNRCRYRGMLSRTPEGIFTLSFPFLSSSLLYFARRVTPVPRFGLHPGGMKRHRGCRSNRYFPIRTLHGRKSPSYFISLFLFFLFFSPSSLPLFFSRTKDVLITRLFSRTFS